MPFDANLYNAAVIGENGGMPGVAFIVEDGRLHAVEQRIADQKKEKAKSELILPLMREALKALVTFSKRNAYDPSSDRGQKEISLKPNEQDQLIEKIQAIYVHLSHEDRSQLSSLIHHKAA
jgi:hypothetical protein